MKLEIKIAETEIDPSLITEQTQIVEYLNELKFSFPIIIDKISLLTMKQYPNG